MVVDELTGECVLTPEIKHRMFVEIQDYIRLMNSLIVDSPDQFTDVDSVLNVWSNLLHLYFLSKGKI